MEKLESQYQPNESYLRVATACPEVRVGDVDFNAWQIGELYEQAAEQSAALVVFPELSLTGYTVGDLVQQKLLLQTAKQNLGRLAELTDGKDTAMIAGLPLVVGNALYNCAAVLAGGKVQGIVPKSNLPNYKEFYEKRWFQTWNDKPNTTVDIDGQDVPFGTDMLFQIGDAKLGIEICEDLWVMDPPSGRLAASGATIIANPSASPEQVGKSDYRRALVGQQSARLLLAYLYAGCDASESTTDIVMSGHQLVAENGHILTERPPLALDQRITLADIDLDHLQNDRIKDTNIQNLIDIEVIDCQISATQEDLVRYTDSHPFIPKGAEAPRVLQNILDIQAQGLATRIRETGRPFVHIGLSGGLDSTLALLVAINAAQRLGIQPKDLIQTITMPGEASSEHTQSNAVQLAQALGLSNEVIPIASLANDQLLALGHNGVTEDTTYENTQARLRTAILFNRSNQRGGLVLGTGDLSEIALGWCTYNGDHMSHYNVNASIPKTLVRHLVAHSAQQPGYAQVSDILESILDTPISPELTNTKGEEISQQTEEIIGPFELHDFFLYHFIRWNDEPRKIAYLANHAFQEQYTEDEINQWLSVFLTRFMGNQWKRSVATDGTKVGPVSLSPRGDWRAPSDIHSAMWLNAIQ